MEVFVLEDKVDDQLRPPAPRTFLKWPSDRSNSELFSDSIGVNAVNRHSATAGRVLITNSIRYTTQIWRKEP